MERDFVAEGYSRRKIKIRLNRLRKRIRMYYLTHGKHFFCLPFAVFSIPLLAVSGISADTAIPVISVILVFIWYCIWKIKENKNPLWEI